MAHVLLALLALPLVADASSKYSLERSTHNRFSDPSADVVSENYAQMRGVRGAGSRSTIFLRNMRLERLASLSKLQSRQSPNKTANVPGVATLEQVWDGVEYLLDVKFGSETRKVIFDTGSGDGWTVMNNFTCTDSLNNVLDRKECNFGTPTNAAFKEIPDQHFHIRYGDGEFATGVMGKMDVEFAGIKVKDSTIAHVNRAFWHGDGISSGILGFAYSAITSAYAGAPNDTKSSNSSTNQHGPRQRVEYDPIFTTMYKRNLTAPVFSVALKRGPDGPEGVVAFGGLPPVKFDKEFATAKVEPFVGTLPGASATALTYYSMTPDALVHTNASAKQTNQFIVDTGTPLNYFPAEDAEFINSLFNPPATYSENNHFIVKCNAKVPKVGIKLGGKELLMDPRDLVIKVSDSTEDCISGIQSAGHKPPFILGDVFLKSLVAVFDVGAGEMRFAKHEY